LFAACLEHPAFTLSHAGLLQLVFHGSSRKQLTLSSPGISSGIQASGLLAHRNTHLANNTQHAPMNAFVFEWTRSTDGGDAADDDGDDGECDGSGGAVVGGDGGGAIDVYDSTSLVSGVSFQRAFKNVCD
jgi:hypothetical protein